MPSNSQFLTRFLLPLLLFTTCSFERSTLAHEVELRPLVTREMREMVMGDTRRRLGRFQICAACTCCGGPRGLCLPSPCCYAINCNIPNKPFGFCSFTPKACNCFRCDLA